MRHGIIGLPLEFSRTGPWPIPIMPMQSMPLGRVRVFLRAVFDVSLKDCHHVLGSCCAQRGLGLFVM